MEPISEERQQKVYEWWIGTPVDIDKATLLDDFTDVIAELPHCDTVALPKLYVKNHDHNWQPNYQFFFTEIVPRLDTESVNVIFEYEQFILASHRSLSIASSTDPIAATADYVESPEEKHDE